VPGWLIAEIAEIDQRLRDTATFDSSFARRIYELGSWSLFIVCDQPMKTNGKASKNCFRRSLAGESNA